MKIENFVQSRKESIVTDETVQCAKGLIDKFFAENPFVDNTNFFWKIMFENTGVNYFKIEFIKSKK